MNKIHKNIINSFIIVPLVATTLSMNVFTTSVNQSIANIQNKTEAKSELSEADKLKIDQAAKIDAYFAKHNLPLEGYGMSMVEAAMANDLPYNLIPALAMRETTGGKFACYNNPFGWGSCKIKFNSFDESIETVASHLGGNRKSTEHYYKGKSVRGILETYNPPSVVPTYANEVMAIMSSIDKIKV